MKLGTLTNVLGAMSLDEACRFLSENGVQMVEIGCGGYPGKDHCDPKILLNDEDKRKEFVDTIKNTIWRSAHSAAMEIWFTPIRKWRRNSTTI